MDPNAYSLVWCHIAFLADRLGENILQADGSVVLRDRLRRETADAHGRVDGLFGSCDFSTEEGYVAFLLAQGTAWETLRPILNDGSRARADALIDDLAVLGVAAPKPLEGVTLPDHASIGHDYVLEGSRLGSTVLLRELRAKAPDLADRASGYLAESAHIDGWKRLSTRLQNDVEGCDRREALIDDALFVFGLFEKAWRVTDSALPKVR